MASITDGDLSRLNDLVCVDPSRALELISAYEQSYGNDKNFTYNVGGFLIDIGCALGDATVVERGIESIKEVAGNVDEARRPMLLYNLGNGWSTLHDMSRRQPNFSFDPDTTPLNEAKRCYREGLKRESHLDRVFHARLLVNYGNCLAHMGRSLEAISEYERALTLARDHPMACGNLGMELAHFASIAGDASLLADANDALERALAGSRLEELGEGGARPVFQRMKQRITEYLDATKRHVHTHTKPVKSRTKRHKSYVEFCAEYHLFLNLSLKHRPSKHSTEDNVDFSMITDIADNTTFPKLSRIVNEVKERYAVARLMVFEARNDSSRMVPFDQMTRYTDNLDYGVYGIGVAKLKLALESAYNILDKIAFFLHDYLHLGMRENRIYFGSIWTDGKKGSGLRSEILRTENYHLYALYDLSRDLAKTGHFGNLADLRHSSTHRYLIPHLERMHWLTEADGPNYHITYWELADRTIALLQLVRNAVIYLVAFIDHEERCKESKSKGLLAPGFVVPYRHDLFRPTF